MKIDRQKVYEKFKGHCSYCGCNISMKEMQVDHFVSKRKYAMGTASKHTDKQMNDFDNLMPSCRYCNKWKNDFSIEQFRKEIGEQIRRLNEYSANYRFAKRYGLILEAPKPIVFYFETYQKINENITQEYQAQKYLDNTNKMWNFKV